LPTWEGMKSGKHSARSLALRRRVATSARGVLARDRVVESFTETETNPWALRRQRPQVLYFPVMALEGSDYVPG
jgi:hypothetical protein